MAPRHFGKLDPDPDSHQGEKQDPVPHQIERWKPWRVILDHGRVQTLEKVSGRIRIRIRIKMKCRNRIRIRIKSEMQDPDPDSHQIDADPQHCL
jgi:hypothetical protein